ncbi:CMRF35-like molecule 9 [Rhynchocyon petersi]
MRLTLLWGCLLLPGYGALTGPKEISGFEGDTVTVRCFYGEELKEYQKYWCRSVGIFIPRCSNTIYAEEAGRKVASGRVSVQDSPQEQTFTVTLRELTLEDKGKYWCGVKRLGFDHTFMVSLIVLPASPDLQLRVTTAKQRKTGAKASPHTGTPLTTVPMTRILAPVLVLLGLLLAASLVVLGSCVLRRRKAHLAKAAESQKVHLSHSVRRKEPAPLRACIHPGFPIWAKR